VVAAKTVPERVPVLAVRVDAPCNLVWFHACGHTVRAVLLSTSLFRESGSVKFYLVLSVIGVVGNGTGT